MLHSASLSPLLHRVRRGRSQAGFIAGYAIAGITLISIVGFGMTHMTRSSATKAYIFNTSKKLQAQISTIHGALTTCALMYPSGDNGTAFHKAFPAGTGVPVLDLNCPGSPHTNKNLWTGRNGQVPPLIPTGMTAWTYTNDATGIFITTTTNGDADIAKAISSVTNKYVATQISFSDSVLKYWILKE